MRNDPSLTNVLVLYRNVALFAGGMAVALFGLVLASLEASWQAREHAHWLLIGAALVSVAQVALFRFGYRALRRALVFAERQRRAAIATANRDALTGAFNRRHFCDELAVMVRKAEREPVGYIQFDVDHLKSINDGNGHGAGDAALRHIVATVSDIVPGAMIGRLGGDEFAIAISGVSSKPALRRLGQRMIEALDQPCRIAGRDMRLSITLGVAAAPEDAYDADELMSKADLALYRGKRSGRQTVMCFESELLTDERHKRFVERELRAAILMDELDLHYQPVFAPGSTRPISCEALVRWMHPVRGMIAPDRFIPIAEKSDLITKLGEWVLRRACMDFPRLGVPVLAINVSAAELRHEGFAARFIQTLEAAGMEPSNLVVEITETVPLQHDSTERRNIEMLRATGVRIAVDDFGAGHASLGYLWELDFDIVKIDRSYTRAITTSRTDAMIVDAIIGIARARRMDVVAEGVETEDQHAALVRSGCTGLQGYLLGRPMPRAAFISQFGERHTSSSPGVLCVA